METLWLLIPLFFLTALVYSMAGFGGGSTYLALLALFSFPYKAMPQVSLLCNLVVVAGGCWFFYQAGHFSFKRVLPFILTSIPMAYWGGSILVSKKLFSLLLGFSLCMAAFRMLISDQALESRLSISWKKSWMVGLPLGALLGFLSGLVGIGGGIYLSPLLLLLGWADSKQASAAASFFILVNSLAGLAGQINKSGFMLQNEGTLLLMGVVFLGGQIGSRLGSQFLSKLVLQRVAAVLILFVGVRLIGGK